MRDKELRASINSAGKVQTNRAPMAEAVHSPGYKRAGVAVKLLLVNLLKDPKKIRAINDMDPNDPRILKVADANKRAIVKDLTHRLGYGDQYSIELALALFDIGARWPELVAMLESNKKAVIKNMLHHVLQGNLKGYVSWCIDGLRNMGLDWPEFKAVERSINAELQEASYGDDEDEDILAHIEEALDEDDINAALDIIGDHGLTLRNEPGLKHLLPTILDQVAYQVINLAVSGDSEAFGIERFRVQLEDMGVRIPNDLTTKVISGHSIMIKRALADKVAKLGKTAERTEELIDLVDELAQWGIDLGEYLPQDKDVIMRMLLSFMKEGHGKAALIYMDKLKHLGINFPEFAVIERSARSDLKEAKSKKQEPELTVKPDGDRMWTVNGQLHREDGPSYEGADGTRWWHRRGKLHREDGPAVEWANGDRQWFIKGRRHRLDGPAYEVDGERRWYVDGKLHRLDGPAVILKDGTVEWWISGEQLPFYEWLNRAKHTLKKEDILRFLLPMIKQDRTILASSHMDDLIKQGFKFPEFKVINRSINAGKLKEADSTEPVLTVDKQGIRRWHLNGKLHREDGPAVEFPDGDRIWSINGRMHRTDGPAIEFGNGLRAWYIKGQELTFSEWLKKTRSKLKKEDIMRFLLLMIKQGNTRGAGDLLSDLARQNVNYPEFATIRKSLSSGLRETDDSNDRDYLTRAIEWMSDGFDALRSNPFANIFPLNTLDRIQLMVRDGDLDIEEVRAALGSIKSKIIAYLLIEIKKSSLMHWEIKHNIRELRHLGINWPELDIIERSLQAEEER